MSVGRLDRTWSSRGCFGVHWVTPPASWQGVIVPDYSWINVSLGWRSASTGRRRRCFWMSMTKDAPPTEQRIGVFLFLVESSAGGTCWSRPIRSRLVLPTAWSGALSPSLTNGGTEESYSLTLPTSLWNLPTMSSDDDHYLDSYLSEILPTIGLDVETYAPYVTGYVSHKSLFLCLYFLH